MSHLKSLVRNGYVPAISVCLVLVLAHWLHSAAFDPLVAAQNQRIRFQTGGESLKNSSGLTPGELALAETVLAKHRAPDGKHTELLYIGNSQTIAIMDQTPGDMITPQWLQVLLARRDAPRQKNTDEEKPVDVNLGSLPNITAPELLIQLVAAGERSPRQADILIASAVLEEFRGLGIRSEVAELASDPEVKARLHSLVEQGSDLSTVRTSLQPLLTSSVSSASSPMTTDSSHSSYAQRIERRLQESSESIPLFADRDNLRGQVALGYHEWRNRLLGITTASVRPVPESSYRASLEMIELALRYAQSAKIKVVLYLAPIRPIQPNPNLPSDVARFRRDVPALCQRYGAKCLDYVDLIPEGLWTNYPDYAVGSKGERDFAHFTGAAHKLLAEKIMVDAGRDLGFVEHEEKLSRR
jgi:hypothetical protein